MAVTGSQWSKQADLTLAQATLEAKSKHEPPSGKVNGQGTNGTMGYWCHFDMNNTDVAQDTEPFDFPVNGDLTVAINATAGDFTGVSGATADVSVIGSVDGTNYVELADKTICVQDSDGTIDGAMKVFVYDYDAKGRLPYMALRIQMNTGTAFAFLVNVIPH